MLNPKLGRLGYVNRLTLEDGCAKLNYEDISPASRTEWLGTFCDLDLK